MAELTQLAQLRDQGILYPGGVRGEEEADSRALRADRVGGPGTGSPTTVACAHASGVTTRSECD